MKTFEEYVTEYDTEKEYSREDVKEILISFKRYNDTIKSFIEQFERVFLVAGEACGYSADTLCQTCGDKHE